jgi:hypothetical protein
MTWKRSDAGPCECDWLRHAALDPDKPIKFDEVVREYHLTYGPAGSSSAVFYFCPFCGGRAPESARASLFAYVPDAEYARLAELTREIATLADAFRILGEPQQDHPDGARTISPDRPDAPRVAESFRMVVYENLSSIANVRVVESDPERVAISYVAKFVGPRPDDPNEAA